MSIEFFIRKKQAIEGVIEAGRTLQKAQAALEVAMQELPAEWRKELPLDLVDAQAPADAGKPAETPESDEPAEPTDPDVLAAGLEYLVFKDEIAEEQPSKPAPIAKPGPSDAVRELLLRHPGGMKIRDIVKALIGKTRTKSANEYRLLYSIIGTLERSGQVRLGEGGLYCLVEQPSVPPAANLDS